MKRISVILPAFYVIILCIPQYAEAQAAEIFRQEGIASWYGPEFDGRPTASGEIFNSSFFTAAHPVLPFGTIVVITNQHNNKQVMVRINDRGPFVSARIIDVSKAAAEALDMVATGTAPVLVESIDRIVIPFSAPAEDPYWTVPPQTSAAPPPAPPPAASSSPTYAPNPAYPPASPAPAAEPPPQTYTPPPVASQPPPVNTPPPAAPKPPANTPPANPAPVVPAPVYSRAALNPDINPAVNKVYRLQVGSYKEPKNAVISFEKLKNAGLSPAYERYGEYFRVVLAGIRGSEVRAVTEKLGAAGFREAVIREER